VGPIIVAQKLLHLRDVSIGTVAFMSSDSGSTGNFLGFEDGYIDQHLSTTKKCDAEYLTDLLHIPHQKLL
jgi:hypothetical protein